MSLRIRCPHHGGILVVREELIGKKIRCPRCNLPVLVSFPEDTLESAGDPPSPQLRPRRSTSAWAWNLGIDPRHQVLLSLTWFAVGLLGALLVPWLGRAPRWLAFSFDLLCPLMTVGLIGWNLVTAIRLVARTGHVLDALPLTIAQFLLFTLLFFQIATHLGTSHYNWETPPSALHWLQFSVVHALRAGDLLDILQLYGVHLQQIRHIGTLTGTCLIAFHLILDLFLIGVLLEAWRGGGTSRESDMALGRMGCGLLVFGGSCWLFSMMWRGWPLREFLLWPLDNVLRVLDVVDAMELYDIKLYQVTPNLFDKTVALGLRIVIAVVMAEPLALFAVKLRKRVLGWKEVEEQDEAGEEENAPAKASPWTFGWRDAIYSAGLLALLVFALPLSRWHVPLEEVSKAATTLDHPDAERSVQMLEKLSRMAPETIAQTLGPSLQELAKVVTTPDHPDAERSMSLVTRLGKVAPGAAAEALGPALAWVAEPRRTQLLRTLAGLGPPGFQYVTPWALAQKEGTASVAVEGLVGGGSQVAPLLVQVFKYSPHPAIRSRAEQALVAMGDAAAASLSRYLERVAPSVPETSGDRPFLVDDYAVWLARLDPDRRYPNLREGYLREVIKLKSGYYPGSEFGALSRLGAPATPVLVQSLRESPDPVARAQAAAALGRQSEDALPALEQSRNDPDPIVREAVSKAIERIKKGKGR